MPASQGLSIDTRQLADAAARIDEIAARLDDLMKVERPHLETVPVGRDEVSVRAAATLDTVQASYATSAVQGVAELREIAAALRAGVGNVTGAEAEFTA
jgi:hypothetical protein